MKYDAAIVGASIAGLSTGMHLAKAGWKTCIVDRRHEIGVPVRCGEATGNRAELARFIDVNETWIAGDITGLAVHAGDGFVHHHRIQDAGVMLHRDRFEKSLAEKTSSLGAEILLDSPVAGLVRDGAGWSGVALEGGKRIEAAYIIDASGVESCVGRWAGMTKNLLLDEIASSMQYRMKSRFCNDGLLHFFIGAGTIPFGYIWVFPKGKDEILVGGGFYRAGREYSNVKHYVDRFIASNIPEARGYENTMITGGIPVALSPKNLVRENILLVGDAARQVNPLTAGGIMNALEAADLASRYLVSRGKNADNQIRDSYSMAWGKNQRRQNKVFMLLREIWFSTPEAEMVPRLKLMISLTKKIPDRSSPFRLPIAPVFRFLMYVLPKTLKNIRILFD
jgi:digeranylgeranylglycerophospholipid reductase